MKKFDYKKWVTENKHGKLNEQTGTICYACQTPDGTGIYGVNVGLADAPINGGTIISTPLSTLQQQSGYIAFSAAVANGSYIGDPNFTGISSGCGLGPAQGYFYDQAYVTEFCPSVGSGTSEPTGSGTTTTTGSATGSSDTTITTTPTGSATGSGAVTGSATGSFDDYGIGGGTQFSYPNNWSVTGWTNNFVNKMLAHPNPCNFLNQRYNQFGNQLQQGGMGPLQTNLVYQKFAVVHTLLELTGCGLPNPNPFTSLLQEQINEIKLDPAAKELLAKREREIKDKIRIKGGEKDLERRRRRAPRRRGRKRRNENKIKKSELKNIIREEIQKHLLTEIEDCGENEGAVCNDGDNLGVLITVLPGGYTPAGVYQVLAGHPLTFGGCGCFTPGGELLDVPFTADGGNTNTNKFSIGTSMVGPVKKDPSTKDRMRKLANIKRKR